MLELLDPAFIDKFAYDEGHLDEIRKFSLLPDNRIGWNYCMDYSWLALRMQNLDIKPNMRIIDVGCGPGAIHGYLEHKYNIDIIGIDIQRWEKDYVDIVGSFSDENLRREHDISPGSVDLIISTSAFEHNTPADHKFLVDVCMESLRPGGHLITTFATAMETTQVPDQWNLSRQAIEDIYGETFDNYDYGDCRQRWHEHREIPARHRERYERWSAEDPIFLAVGAHIIKFF